MSILLKAARPALSAVALAAAQTGRRAVLPAAAENLTPSQQQPHRCFSGCGCGGSSASAGRAGSLLFNNRGVSDRHSFSATPDHSGTPQASSSSTTTTSITERFYSVVPAMRPPADASGSAASSLASVAPDASRRMTTDASNRDIADLLSNNKRWVAQQKQQDPEFFVKLGGIHKPRWVGALVCQCLSCAPRARVCHLCGVSRFSLSLLFSLRGPG
jgi:hypothetical protein